MKKLLILGAVQVSSYIPENVTAPMLSACEWSEWLNTDNPTRRDEYSDYEADDERYETITRRGIKLCRSEPAAIQCWDNQLSVEVPNGPLCNATIGLYCDWLCSDYSIRVACCEESEEDESELDREIRYDLSNNGTEDDSAEMTTSSTTTTTTDSTLLQAGVMSSSDVSLISLALIPILMFL